MTSPSLRRQDASARMPLAVCHDGLVIVAIPAGTDPAGIAVLRDLSARRVGVDPAELEILVVCHLHPQFSAVDCLTCEPVD